MTDDLRDKLAAVNHDLGCDCGEDAHRRETADWVDYLMPSILTDRQQAIDDALERAAQVVSEHPEYDCPDEGTCDHYDRAAAVVRSLKGVSA